MVSKENKDIIDSKIDLMYQLKNKSKFAGGPARIDAQHEKGKLTARERLDLICDKGTFREIDALAHHHSSQFGLDKSVPLGDGVVSGFAEITGKTEGTLRNIVWQALKNLREEIGKNGL